MPDLRSPDRRALLAGLAGAALVGANKPKKGAVLLRASNIFWPVGDAGTMHGFMAIPVKARGRQPAVIVAHAVDGLNQATRELTMRIALAGFVALAPDFLSPAARTPSDPAAARAAVAALDPAATLYHARLTLHWLRWNRYTTGRIGAVGIGWGADLVQRLAADAGADLAVALPVPPAADAPAWADLLTTLKEKLA